MFNELLISAALLGGGSYHDVDNNFNEFTSMIEQREDDLRSTQVDATTIEDSLNRQERQYIVNCWHLAVNKMNYLMDKADQESFYIFDTDIRHAAVGVISGTIAALPSKNLYAIAIGGCLGGLGNIAGDSYLHFRKAKDYVKQAKFYASAADDLQERLWRG